MLDLIIIFIDTLTLMMVSLGVANEEPDVKLLRATSHDRPGMQIS